MKNLIISLFIESLTFFCFGQASHYTLYDTLLNIDQRGCYRISYQVIHTTDLDEDGRLLDSSRLVIILSDTSRATIRLPIPDEDVKNFAIAGVRKVYKGFALSTSYGGGDCIIRRTLIFKISDEQIYLHKIISNYIYENSIASRKIVKRIHPNLPFSKIDLNTYLTP